MLHERMLHEVFSLSPTQPPLVPPSSAKRIVEGGNRAHSVSELSRLLKGHIESRFSRVSVRGEISGLKQTERGHIYFSLKDEHSSLDAVCWSGRVRSLRHRAEEGLEVIAEGGLTAYPQRSRYQLQVTDLEAAGEGALLKLLEQRRRKLTAEGLFSAEHKQRLATLPRRIALLTSPSGAVLHDIVQRIAARCAVDLLLLPISVQGRDAESSILSAFSLLASRKFRAEFPDLDLVIVARGGGSIEDLWVFNEESVIRAAFACALPVVSAIGHESDVTLLDYVADLRASTPSAAAELSVPDKRALLRRLTDLELRLQGLFSLQFQSLRTRLSVSSRSLPRALEARTERARLQLATNKRALGLAIVSYLDRLSSALTRQRLSRRWLADKILRARQRLTNSEIRQQRAIGAIISGRREELSKFSQLLRSLSYGSVLARGFALVRVDDKIVRSAKSLRAGQEFDTLFSDKSNLRAVALGERAETKQRLLKL